MLIYFQNMLIENSFAKNKSPFILGLILLSFKAETKFQLFVGIQEYSLITESDSLQD